MIIISAKNAFVKERTGIEEYTYQLLRHLNKSKGEEILVYTNKIKNKIDFKLNFDLKLIRLPFLWTQLGLSLEMVKIFLKGEIKEITLFIPSHVMPLIHPKKTIVTIHGLEYEYFPAYYSWFSRRYLRWSTKYAVKRAKKLIAVSQNTKKDLIKLYGADSRKIEVIWHGVSEEITNNKFQITAQNPKSTLQDFKKQIKNTNYFLYLGRIELKKNILGIIKAFEKFKVLSFKFQDYKLVLVGGKGYGWKIVKHKTYNIKHKKDIIFMGHVNDKEKWQLLRNAEALVFPSFYEGFGLPILEAQVAGVPVITSQGSSTEEITSLKISNDKLQIPNKFQKPNSKYLQSALLVDPNKPKEIAEAMYQVATNQTLCDELIRKGYQNIKRFSWQKTAQKTIRAIKKKQEE